MLRGGPRVHGGHLAETLDTAAEEAVKAALAEFNQVYQSGKPSAASA